VRLDSRGIFSLVPVASIRSMISLDTLQPDSEESRKLPVFHKGQGFPVTSYVGGPNAFAKTMAARQTAVAVVAESSLPAAVRKNVAPEKFDKMGLLFRGGARMPLMVFSGKTSWRTPEALARRGAQRAWRSFGRGKGRMCVVAPNLQ